MRALAWTVPSALLLTAPATAAYKLANGNQAPFSDEDVQEVLAWSFPLSGSRAETPGAGAGAGDPALLPDAVETVAKVLTGILAIPLAWADTMGDGQYQEKLASNGATSSGADQALTVIGWIDVAASVLIQILSIPDSLNWFSNPAEWWQDSVWIGGFVLPGMSAAFLCPRLQSSPRAQEWGKVALSVGGAALIGTGIAAAVVGKQATPPIANDWDIGTAILSPMDNALEFLRLQGLIQASWTWSLWAKLAINVLTDLAAGVTQGPG
jgi:hypothetical protein